MQQIFTLTEEVITLVNEHERFRATLNSLRYHAETDSTYDELDLDFEVIGLPQHRLIPVHNVEPITIYIGERDVMPVVKVRDDFPSVPHLNILEDNISKTLCYSELRYEEIKSKMSGRFLLTCIEDWFLKTSMNKLHRPDQPIEPYFPYVTDVIVWDKKISDDGFEKYTIEDREFGKLMYGCENGAYYAVLRISAPPDYSNRIHNMPQTLYDLLHLFGYEAQFRRWLCAIIEIIHNVKKYNQYFQQAKNKLLACNAIIHILIPKSRTTDDLLVYDWRTFVTKSSLKCILSDFGLALSGSKLVDSGKIGGTGKNILVQPFNVHLPNFRFQNKLLNAIDLDCGNEKIVLIGAGALGSHILNNCLREGYGNWTIIDHDYFWPHNVARHILTVKDIGYTKVRSLEKLSRTIQADSTVNAIAEDFFSGSDLVYNALGQADIILDVSTSIAVERCLALETKSNARKITCFLNPKGTATIMLLESSDGKARLDLLEMQYYRELVSNLIYIDHMALPETSVYSGSCRNITSRISQDNISLSAALCSKALKTYFMDDTGKIIIWRHEDDAVNRDIFFSDNWIVYNHNGWVVEISELLLEDIRSDRIHHMPNETGGVLIGAFDLSRKRVYVVSQVKAPEDSISSPTSFIRGCLNLPQQLKFIQKVTFDNLTYIGEWHSHPNDNTKKSTDDGVLHHAIVDYNRGNCLPGCMMIVGESSYSIYIDE